MTDDELLARLNQIGDDVDRIAGLIRELGKDMMFEVWPDPDRYLVGADSLWEWQQAQAKESGDPPADPWAETGIRDPRDPSI